MFKYKKTVSTLFCVLLLTGLCACGGGNSSSASSASNPPESAPGQTPSAVSQTDGAYPVSIVTYNYEGGEVTTTYEKAPEKVLAVYQGSIETMLALGQEDRIVAAAGLDNAVKEEWRGAFSKLNYLDEFAPGKENVIMLQPDMILSWGSYFGDKKLGDVDYWTSSGVNTYINTNTRAGGHPRTLQNEYTDILNLGKIFNVQDRAEELVRQMREEVERVKNQAAQAQEKKSVLIIEFAGDDITNYGADSLGGDMVTQLGADLAAPEASKIGKEDIVNLNPDVLFVVYMEREVGGDAAQQSVNLVTQNPAFSSLKAVQEGRVYPVMLGDMYASGVRAMDGIYTFARGIFPELYQ